MKKPICLAFLSLLLLSRPATALTINVTYDASVTNFPNASQVEAAFATAVQVFQDLYTNKATINITMYLGPAGPFAGDTISLGESQFELVGSSYSEITNALFTHRVSAADISSVASLPAVDPIGNNINWLVPLAEARALNLSGLPPDQDGGVSFATNVTYTFDPNNRSVAGKFDFIGVAEHEISEVLGRCTFGLQSEYVPYDLFRFTNAAARNFDPSATNVYFSVNNGVTALKFFYTNAAFGDVQDWLSTATPDSFDAFASSGHILPLSIADIAVLDVLGYNGPGLAPPRLFVTNSAAGTIRIRFVNSPGRSFTVLESTNLTTPLASWTVLGTPAESPAGQFQFTDTTATNQQRFYDVRSP
ncbi:MAG TPA: NF038122 family metalloprotease [Verrucomicrobiae bacterium]|jgi:hypothetical protein